MIHIREGKLLVKDGKLCRTCCPGDYPWISPPRDIEYSEDDCAYCPEGETPAQITARFKEMVFCDGCYIALGHSYKWTNTDNPNGLYLLTQSEIDACQWLGQRDNQRLKYTRYSDESCTNVEEVIDYYPTTIYVIATKTGIDEATIELDWSIDKFLSGTVATTNCMTISTPVNNTLNICSYIYNWMGGTVELKEGNQVP